MNQESKAFLKKAFTKLHGVNCDSQNEDEKKIAESMNKLFDQFIVIVEQRLQYDNLRTVMENYEKQLI